MTRQPLSPFSPNASSSTIVTAVEKKLSTLKPPWIRKSPISQNASAVVRVVVGATELAALT